MKNVGGMVLIQSFMCKLWIKKKFLGKSINLLENLNVFRKMLKNQEIYERIWVENGEYYK